MAHPRELLVQAVVALLIAANTAAGSRVTRTRTDPHKNPQLSSGAVLPALSVYALNDPADLNASSEMEEAHALELKITGWVAGTDAVPADQAANALMDQVGIALRADEYLGGLASGVVHRGTTMNVVESDGRSSPAIGIAQLTCTVKYHIALDPT